MSMIPTYKNTLANVDWCKLTDKNGYEILAKQGNVKGDEYEMFHLMLDDLGDCILERSAVEQIFSKIETLTYFNKGYITDGSWESYRHDFYINGELFRFNTGIGINCQEHKNERYNYYKLLFWVVMDALENSYCPYQFIDADEFCNEFGYNETVEQYKKGCRIFKDICEQSKICRRIFGMKVIVNLQDIVQL